MIFQHTKLSWNFLPGKKTLIPQNLSHIQDLPLSEKLNKSVLTLDIIQRRRKANVSTSGLYYFKSNAIFTYLADATLAEDPN